MELRKKYNVQIDGVLSLGMEVTVMGVVLYETIPSWAAAEAWIDGFEGEEFEKLKNDEWVILKLETDDMDCVPKSFIRILK